MIRCSVYLHPCTLRPQTTIETRKPVYETTLLSFASTLKRVPLNLSLCQRRRILMRTLLVLRDPNSVIAKLFWYEIVLITLVFRAHNIRWWFPCDASSTRRAILCLLNWACSRLTGRVKSVPHANLFYCSLERLLNHRMYLFPRKFIGFLVQIIEINSRQLTYPNLHLCQLL